MPSYLGPEDQALRKFSGEVLHYIWDPIGVAGIVNARDEYDGYVDDICSLIWSGADAEAITNHLIQIAEVSMGIFDSQDRASAAAHKLLGWRAAVTR